MSAFVIDPILVNARRAGAAWAALGLRTRLGVIRRARADYGGEGRSGCSAFAKRCGASRAGPC